MAGLSNTHPPHHPHRQPHCHPHCHPHRHPHRDPDHHPRRYPHHRPHQTRSREWLPRSTTWCSICSCWSRHASTGSWSTTTSCPWISPHVPRKGWSRRGVAWARGVAWRGVWWLCRVACAVWRSLTSRRTSTRAAAWAACDTPYICVCELAECAHGGRGPGSPGY